jgi:hypothetical protein
MTIYKEEIYPATMRVLVGPLTIGWGFESVVGAVDEMMILDCYWLDKDAHIVGDICHHSLQ